MRLPESKYLKEKEGIKFFEVPLEKNRSVKAWFTTKWLTKPMKKFRMTDYEAQLVKLLEIMKLDVEDLIFLKQVHGNGVIDIQKDESGSVMRGVVGIGDALITNIKNVPLVIKVADCVSIQLWDPTSGAIANIHHGWRSGAKNIVGRTISDLRSLYDFKAETAKAVIMPSITQSNYMVGNEVFREYVQNIENSDGFFKPEVDGGWWFDLRGIAKEMLLSEGIDGENIIDLDFCTLIHPALFYSYRRDAEFDGDNVGRMYAIIMKK